MNSLPSFSKKSFLYLIYVHIPTKKDFCFHPRGISISTLVRNNVEEDYKYIYNNH